MTNKTQKQSFDYLEENQEKINNLAEDLNTDKEFIASAIIEIGLNHLEGEKDEFLALYKAYMVNGKESKAKEKIIDSLTPPIDKKKRPLLEEKNLFELFELYTSLKDVEIRFEEVPGLEV